MSNSHPVLNQVKLETKEAVKKHVETIIDLDMILQSLTQKEAVIARIKDLIRNC